MSSIAITLSLYALSNTSDEDNTDNTKLALGLGLGLGIPAFLVCLCCCLTTWNEECRRYEPRVTQSSKTTEVTPTQNAQETTVIDIPVEASHG